jgi:phosphoribosylaminoimidazolecarboxamide formyltransferase/IMP cyclohydrolase
MSDGQIKIRRALISVSNKEGLFELAAELASQDIEIYSTGGTSSALRAAGYKTLDVSDYTQFPEMMHGRLKTLHPKVFGGILARRQLEEDRAAMESHGILPFDLIVVNLYPFEVTVARPECKFEEAIEQIDIGGPSLLRAAAKNHAHVAVVSEPYQYAELIEGLRKHGGTTLELRRKFAAEAFGYTGCYDSAIAAYFAEQVATPFPASMPVGLRRVNKLRYGENPHQAAAVYRAVTPPPTGSLVGAKQLHGKELSFNNLLDLDSALAIVRNIELPSAVVIKHNNPCGAAQAQTLADAISKALAGDPLSAYGGVLAVNRLVDAETARVLCAPGLFVEAIAAPDFSAEAKQILTTEPKWKLNVRLLQVGEVRRLPITRQVRHLEGGMLVQDTDTAIDPTDDWKWTTKAIAPDALLGDVKFIWEICKHVKSNAIVVGKEGMVRGVGAGQMSRVDSVEIALHKAGEHARGAVMASDAFFPFSDSIEKAAKAGVKVIVQPGGSKKDDEVIAACDAHGIAMLMTGRRHFKH